jgi:hypothetical protein
VSNQQKLDWNMLEKAAAVVKQADPPEVLEEQWDYPESSPRHGQAEGSRRWNLPELIDRQSQPVAGFDKNDWMRYQMLRGNEEQLSPQTRKAIGEKDRRNEAAARAMWGGRAEIGGPDMRGTSRNPYLGRTVSPGKSPLPYHDPYDEDLSHRQQDAAKHAIETDISLPRSKRKVSPGGLGAGLDLIPKNLSTGVRRHP